MKYRLIICHKDIPEKKTPIYRALMIDERDIR